MASGTLSQNTSAGQYWHWSELPRREKIGHDPIWGVYWPTQRRKTPRFITGAVLNEWPVKVNYREQQLPPLPPCQDTSLTVGFPKQC